MDAKRLETLKKEYLKNGLQALLKEADWKYLKIFNDKWNINSSDFEKMIENSIYAIKNFSGRGANAFSTINMIAQNDPVFIKNVFTNLYDENSGIDVTTRINNFREAFKDQRIKDFLEDKGIAENGKAYSDAQSNGAVVSYLWLKYPNDYYQYVPKKEKLAYEYLNPGLTITGKSFENKYNEIKLFMDELKGELFADTEFISKVETTLNKNGLDINNTKLINHVAYWASKLNTESTSKTSSGSETDTTEDNSESENYDYDVKLLKRINHKEISNIILYGPPGTGKTYNTKALAVYMCDKGKIYSDYNEICKRYKELVNDGRIKFITFHQSYSYEEFIGGLKATTKSGVIKYGFEDGVFKKFCDENRYKDEKCVFIIDEINRGNIAKIFGELITLIEITKREGMPEETSAILPYKKTETFVVPKNVNIIGTMNTADRSITQLDTALRRRFDFIEMMPNYKSIEIESENSEFVLSDLIEIMNKRIEVLYDREHVIGHAFFKHLANGFKISDLTEVFSNKIIPLLKEYFYDDYYKIQLVLGEFDPTNVNNFIVRVDNDKNLFSSKVDLDDIDNYTYVVNNINNINVKTYEMILGGSSTEEQTKEDSATEESEKAE